MTFVVIGGSAGVGRHVAEALARRGVDLVLTSRDARDVGVQAADLALRHGVAARGVALDLGKPGLDWGELDGALSALGPPKGVILAAGEAVDDDGFDTLDGCAEAIVRANFLSACLLLAHLGPQLVAAGDAVVIGIGSVAATRGRSRNVAYSASKRALASCFESFRHAYGPRGVRVQFYRAGYIATNAAFGRRLPLPAASPERFARLIVDNADRSSRVAYYPWYWRPVCAALRLLPWPLFGRLDA